MQNEHNSTTIHLEQVYYAFLKTRDPLTLPVLVGAQWPISLIASSFVSCLTTCRLRGKEQWHKHVSQHALKNIIHNG